MEDFIVYNPVKLHFGKNVIDNLGKTASELGKKALLVYGKGSVVYNGQYDIVKGQLQDAGIELAEYSGIKSNPLVEDVNKATELAANENVDFVVGLGGGSVIDSAKLISVCIPEKLDGWDVMTMKSTPTKNLPLIAVVTIAATGSEMNNISVIQDTATGQKRPIRNDLMFPKHAFLNPEFTYSVPADYTAYGVIDLIAHALEAYFGQGSARLSDRWVESIIKETMHFAPLLIKDLTNYEYRANVMWAATSALNGTTNPGRISGDFGVHALSYALSYLYDIHHGASLAVAYPAWLRFMRGGLRDRITELGNALFCTITVDQTIYVITKFFKSLGAKTSLSEYDLEADAKEKILEYFVKNKPSGRAHQLKEEDYQQLVDLMFDDLIS